MDENNGKLKGMQKEGGAKMKSGEYKVHHMADAAQVSSPERRSTRNLTRYYGMSTAEMNSSQMTALSSSQSKLIRNQKTDDGLGQLRSSSPFDGSGMSTKNAGFISQNFDDNQ